MEIPIIHFEQAPDSPQSLLNPSSDWLTTVKLIDRSPTNGKDAITLVNKEQPDLVLLDIIMPDMSGREVCVVLKGNSATAAIPIIFVTVKASQQDEQAGFEVGAADYITKPFNPAVVKLRVKNQLELKQHREQLERRVKQRTTELIQARDQAHARERDANEREQLLWTVLESSLDAFIMTNHQGKIIDFNPAAERLFGYQRTDVMGRNLAHLIIPPELRDVHAKGVGQSQQSGAPTWIPGERRMITEGIRADGKRVDLEVAISMVTSHGRPVYTSFLRDITSTKQLLLALEASLGAAETSARAKDLFLANMSHEIRTPMNGILGMIDLALRAEPEVKTREFLTHAKTSSRLLLRVINDILDYSKITAGKMVMESGDFYLGDVLEDAISLFRNSENNPEVELIVSAPAQSLGLLVGDRVRLQQILINLTANAIKFTNTGEIHIKAVPIEQTAEQVRLQFSVSDTGIGLSEEQIASLFSPFVQADSSTTRKFGGTGLGLTICKRLVELMEGTIWVESQRHKGSTFFFTTVLKRNTHIPPYIPRLEEDMLSLKILIVDDSEHAMVVTGEVLVALGLQNVDMSASGFEALNLLQVAAGQGAPYSVVLLDWFMPEMDGLEVAEKIVAGAWRESAQPADLPLPKIVLMTSYHEEHILQQAERIGVDRCLFKPVTPSLLLDTLLDIHGKTITQGYEAVADQYGHSYLSQVLAGVTILLVDDNPINQQVAQEILTSVGIHVILANNGQEAIDAIQTSYFDLVFMDVQMPVMDGYKATRIIRSVEYYSDLPIIAMTANVLTGDRENCLAAGMSDYVAKPIDIDQLFATLLKWIKPNRNGLERQPESLAAAGKCGTLPEPKEIELPEDFPGIHWAEGLRRVCYNRKLMRKVIVRFGEGNCHADQELRTMLQAGDFAQAAKRTHAIKGIAGNIAAVPLHRDAQELEQAIKNEDMVQINPVLERFSQELQRVVAIAAALKEDVAAEESAAKNVVQGEEGNNSQPPAIDVPHSENLQTDLLHLSNLLVSQNLDAEEMVATLKLKLQDHHMEQELTSLDHLIQQYEFSQAHELLKQLAAKLGIVLS